jgi:hypothetical protein
MPKVILGAFWRRFLLEIPADKATAASHALIDPAGACRDVRCSIASYFLDIRAIKPKADVAVFNIRAGSAHDWWPKVYVGATALFAAVLRCMKEMVPADADTPESQELDGCDAYLQKVQVMAAVRIVDCPAVKNIPKVEVACPYYADCGQMKGKRAATCPYTACKRRRKREL